MELHWPRIKLNETQLFTAFVLFWIGLGFFGLLLSILGIFYGVFLITYVVLGVTTLIYATIFNKNKLKVNYSFFLILLLSLAAIVIFSHYTTPTIFSGRDQGSLSEAAIQLSKNHNLTFSSTASQEFFKIYGPGKALNFPGFQYTARGELFTQFPLGYISWLAIFYSFFGLKGFIAANGITFLIFLLSFYLIARQYMRFSSALISILLILTSFVFSWFFKFTLSENLALMLTWFGVYEFILFTKHRERFYLFAALISFFILLFTRIEAAGFIIAIMLILFIKYRNWQYLLFIIIGRKLLLLLAGLIFLYILTLTIHAQSCVSFLKNIIGPFIALGSGIQDYSESNSISFLEKTFFTIRILFIYAILPFILLGISSFVYLWKRRKLEMLLPFLILLPSFIYIIHPSISPDHPWMLRRFVFSVIPVSILYTLYLLDWICKKRIYLYIISTLMIVTNLLVFMPYITFSPHQNLLPQIQTISTNFKDSDLILVDRAAVEDGWSMITGPLSTLFGLQAVYFFNPNDLAKLDLKKFNNIYFIIPNSNLNFYHQGNILQELMPIKDYSLNTTQLLIQTGAEQEKYNASIELPRQQNITIYGKIYLLTK